MKELEDLTEIERAVLLACCNANNFSLGSHVSIERIMRRLDKKIQRKYAKKDFKKLISNGFIVKHPTRGSMTYELSPKGLKAGNKLK